MRLLLAWLLSCTAALAACPGYQLCPAVTYPAALKSPQGKSILAGIDAMEAAEVKAASSSGLTFAELLGYLGGAITFDRTLSARGNEACALCHSPATGFAGGVAAFTASAGVFPGTLPWRTGPRAPQSLAYAAAAPVLTYRPGTHDFAGGNFRDSRATGAITGSPAADQTAFSLTSPFEMALPDPACAVRRLAQAPYGPLFGKVWGARSLAIQWPASTEAICARPNAGGTNQAPLPLARRDRVRALLTVQQIGLTVQAFEANMASPVIASPAIASPFIASPFTAKFDAVQAHAASFTTAEQRGRDLFTGRAHCAACHEAGGRFALFTAFTSANIGVPRNPALPFLQETMPDTDHYRANPAGPAFADEGLGGFLASDLNTNPLWRAQAGRFMGAFQVPTLRNVAARPAPGFPRVYMHNGAFADLRTVVHFLDTRDVLPVCKGDGEIGVTCWPAPEEPRNIDRRLTGNLGLTSRDETDLVAFLGTLDDGYTATGAHREARK